LKQINLYYDNECPFCKEYSKYIELRKKYDVHIINARVSIERIKFFKEKGFDINDGMIVETNDKIYHGADAAEFLDKCIHKSTFIDYLIGFFIKIPGFKGILYPFVKIIRLLLLKIYGKNTNIKY
jgi:predicted DCC family thiol-disulfide oxidoreductase YuxK